MDRSNAVMQRNALLTTKLYIPPAHAKLVSRPQLIERLNAGMDGKLTLISAPAGFGKTTLLSEWQASARINALAVAWVSLDEGDNDPALFWSYRDRPRMPRPISGGDEWAFLLWGMMGGDNRSRQKRSQFSLRCCTYCSIVSDRG